MTSTRCDQGELELSLPDAMERWWLPRRPLCCDAYDEQQRRARGQALHYRLIEPNPAALTNLLVVDIDDDSSGYSAVWGHVGMTPNLVAVNPANQHAHAVWVLTDPVCRTEMARLRPLRLCRAVTEGLRRSCDGDAAYTGHLMKNPLSPAWEAEVIARDTYSLAQLAAALEDAGDMPPKSWARTKPARTIGLGRNVTLFDTARLSAYRHVRRMPDRTEAASEELRAAIRATCHEINAGFPEPLPYREVEDTAKSIHKWVTTRFDGWLDGAAVCAATFTVIQAARGRKGGKASGQARRIKSGNLVKEVLQ